MAGILGKIYCRNQAGQAGGVESQNMAETAFQKYRRNCLSSMASWIAHRFTVKWRMVTSAQKNGQIIDSKFAWKPEYPSAPHKQVLIQHCRCNHSIDTDSSLPSVSDSAALAVAGSGDNCQEQAFDFTRATETVPEAERDGMDALRLPVEIRNICREVLSRESATRQGAVVGERLSDPSVVVNSAGCSSQVQFPLPRKSPEKKSEEEPGNLKRVLLKLASYDDKRQSIRKGNHTNSHVITSTEHSLKDSDENQSNETGSSGADVALLVALEMANSGLKSIRLMY